MTLLNYCALVRVNNTISDRLTMAIFPGMKDLKDLTSTIADTIAPGPAVKITIPEEYDIQPGDDHAFMARALKLAEKGICSTHPNPRVGCVITKNGVIVGEGYHRVTGQPHAEVHALRAAGRYAEGATLYVNLEPCCHQGRTPPCTDAIIKAGVRRVVIAMEDPNPEVNHSGVSALRKAGIEVETGVNNDSASWLNRGYVKRIKTGMPWVTLKIAASMDGKTAMSNGESQWITSEQAREDAHQLRASSSAIMTGIGTVLRDDPQMTARLSNVADMKTEPTERQPLRVIVDSRLSTPASARILSQPGDVLIVTAPSNLSDAALYSQSNVEVSSCEMAGRAINLEALMQMLGEKEINNLMLEAGAKLSGSMLKENLVDELVIYMAPDLLGSDARGMFLIPGLDSISEKLNMEFRDVRRVGRDMRITLQILPQHS